MLLRYSTELGFIFRDTQVIELEELVAMTDENKHDFSLAGVSFLQKENPCRGFKSHPLHHSAFELACFIPYMSGTISIY